MPSSHWGNRFALGLIVGIGLTLIVFFLADAAQNHVESDVEQVGQASEGGGAQAYESKKEQNPLTYWARRLVSFEDTSAQWIMMFFTIVAAVLLWRTLIATQTMAEDARRIGEAQVRAYLTITQVWLDFRNGSQSGSEIRVSLANTGNSPAKRIRFDYYFTYADGAETEPGTLFINDLQGSATLNLAIPARIAQASVGEHVPAHRQSVVTLSLSLAVTFEDTFGKVRTEPNEFSTAFQMPPTRQLQFTNTAAIPADLRDKPWMVRERGAD